MSAQPESYGRVPYPVVEEPVTPSSLYPAVYGGGITQYKPRVEKQKLLVFKKYVLAAFHWLSRDIARLQTEVEQKTAERDRIAAAIASNREKTPPPAATATKTTPNPSMYLVHGVTSSKGAISNTSRKILRDWSFNYATEFEFKDVAKIPKDSKVVYIVIEKVDQRDVNTVAELEKKSKVAVVVLKKTEITDDFKIFKSGVLHMYYKTEGNGQRTVTPIVENFAQFIEPVELFTGEKVADYIKEEAKKKKPMRIIFKQVELKVNPRAQKIPMEFLAPFVLGATDRPVKFDFLEAVETFEEGDILFYVYEMVPRGFDWDVLRDFVAESPPSRYNVPKIFAAFGVPSKTEDYKDANNESVKMVSDLFGAYAFVADFNWGDPNNINKGDAAILGAIFDAIENQGASAAAETEQQAEPQTQKELNYVRLGAMQLPKNIEMQEQPLKIYCKQITNAQLTNLWGEVSAHHFDLFKTLLVESYGKTTAAGRKLVFLDYEPAADNDKESLIIHYTYHGTRLQPPVNDLIEEFFNKHKIPKERCIFVFFGGESLNSGDLEFFGSRYGLTTFLNYTAGKDVTTEKLTKTFESSKKRFAQIAKYIYNFQNK